MSWTKLECVAHVTVAVPFTVMADDEDIVNGSAEPWLFMANSGDYPDILENSVWDPITDRSEVVDVEIESAKVADKEATR